MVSDELYKDKLEDNIDYIKVLIKTEKNHETIVQKLIEHCGFSSWDAKTAILDVLKAKLRKAFFLTLGLLLGTIIMCSLFLYFKSVEEGFARTMIEHGNGIDLGNGEILLKGSFDTYTMFGKFAIYFAIASFIQFCIFCIKWINVKRIENVPL